MRNVLYRLMTLQYTNYYRILLMVLAAMGFLAMATGAQNANATNAICSIYGVFTTVQTAIFVLGIMLMILGGALYAGANLLPGSQKGGMQGYGMGMIIGGVIGVIIAVLAPYILGVISGNPSTSFTSVPAGCP